MGKASRRKRRTTSLSGHERTGKVLKPPLKTLPNLRLSNWLRDSVPDLLWPASVLAVQGKTGLFIICDLQDLLAPIFAFDDEDRPPAGAPTADPLSQNHGAHVPYDGRLTSLEAMTSDQRAAVIAALVDDGAYETVVPEALAHSLGMYPEAPGRWLIEPWFARGLSVDPGVAERHLSEVLEAVRHGQSEVSTWLKATLFGAMLKTGKFMFARDVESVSLLSRYPDGLKSDELGKANAFIRASAQMFIASEFLGPERAAAVHAWSEAFWRSNWRLFTCRRIGDGGRFAGEFVGSREEFVEAATEAKERLADLRERVAVAADGSDPDLYAPQRHEVLTGIATRALRLLEGVPFSPSLWTSDQAQFLARGTVEARIIMAWLIKKDDPELFERFKDYGRGRLKLRRLHLEKYMDSLEDPPDSLREHIDQLDTLVNAEIDEEWQDIDVSGDFAGVNRRKMAEEACLGNEYRLLFQPLSDAAHGDWSAIQTSAMQPCANPLHRWHWIARLEPGRLVAPDLVGIALQQLGALVDALEEALPLDGLAEAAVRARAATMSDAPAGEE